jgi:hypothetical protein
MSLRKKTFGLIVGNRGFFVGHFAHSGRGWQMHRHAGDNGAN